MAIYNQRTGASTSSAYTVFRGINKASYESTRKDTSIINLAEKSSVSKENKTSITVALEDFSEKFNGFGKYKSSNITAKDAKEGFFKKKTDNIYASDEGQRLLKSKERIFQNDIFIEDAQKYGGIKYSESEDNKIASALAFAKADIEAVEASYNKARGEKANKYPNALELNEIATYSDYQRVSLSDSMKWLDLDGNIDCITPEEYASFLVATDGITTKYEGRDNLPKFKKITFDNTERDGLISSKEAHDVKGCDDSMLLVKANQVYQTYFAQ